VVVIATNGERGAAPHPVDHLCGGAAVIHEIAKDPDRIERCLPADPRLQGPHSIDVAVQVGCARVNFLACRNG